MTVQIECQLFADYFQFYVADARFQTDTGEIWNDETSYRMLAVGDDLIAVGTVRNMDVSVMVEILRSEPDGDFANWQQVIDCSLDVRSGMIVVVGCTDYLPDALHHALEAGTYKARVSYRGLDQISEDGLDGEDFYRIQLWPGTACEPTVVKTRPANILPRN